MKTLAHLLEKGNLTPRERIMIVIKNSYHLMTTGKHLFDESEMGAVSEQWKTTSNAEVNEYNKYLAFWKSYKHLRIDMQTLFLNTQIENANIEKILTLFFYNKEIEKVEELLKARTSATPNPSAKEYILENTGIEYRSLIHTYTFMSLPKKVQDDLVLLDEYIKSDYYYLKDEEALAEIIKDKTEIDSDDEKKIVKLIIDSMRWDHEEIFKDNPTNFMRSVFSGHFAGMPFEEIGELVAEEYGIQYEDTTEMYEQLLRIPDIKKIIRRVLKQEIKSGLFIDYYIPLCNSDGKTTYNGETKMTHKEIMSHWLSAKEKVTKEIDGYIEKGVLTLKKRTLKYSRMPTTYKVIMGTGLYYADESLPFVADYKQQVESLTIYGYLFKEIAESNLYENLQYLYAYRDICKKISHITNVDVVPSVQQYIDDAHDSIHTHNLYIKAITNTIDEKIHLGRKYDFYAQSLLESFEFDTSKVKPAHDQSLEIFEDVAKSELGYEWESLDSRKDLFSIDV